MVTVATSPPLAASPPRRPYRVDPGVTLVAGSFAADRVVLVAQAWATECTGQTTVAALDLCG